VINSLKNALILINGLIALALTTNVAQADAINLFKAAPSYVQEAFYRDACEEREKSEWEDYGNAQSDDERRAAILPGLGSKIYFVVSRAYDKEIDILNTPEDELIKLSNEFCHAAKRVMK
jgi:hypothetical protein